MSVQLPAKVPSHASDTSILAPGQRGPVLRAEADDQHLDVVFRPQLQYNIWDDPRHGCRELWLLIAEGFVLASSVQSIINILINFNVFFLKFDSFPVR